MALTQITLPKETYSNTAPDLTGINSSITDLQNDMGNVETALSNTDANVAQIIIDLANTDANVVNLSLDLSNTDGNVSQLVLDLGNTDGNVGQLVLDLGNTDSNVSNLSNSLANTQVNTNVGWTDMLGDVSTALTGAAVWTTAQIRDTGFLLGWLTGGNQNDYIQQKLQFSHGKLLNSNVDSLHVHYLLSQNPAAGETVKLQWQWAWVNIGDTIPAIGSWATNTHTITFTGSELGNTHYLDETIHDLAPPANETVSSILLVKITRISTGAGADTFPGDFGVLYMDAHYQAYRFGSLYEFGDTPPS